MTICWTAFLCHMLPRTSGTRQRKPKPDPDESSLLSVDSTQIFCHITHTHTQAHMYMQPCTHTNTTKTKSWISYGLCICIYVYVFASTGAQMAEEHVACLRQSRSALGCTLPAPSSMSSRAVVGLNYNHSSYGAAESCSSIGFSKAATPWNLSIPFWYFSSD